MTIEIGSTLRTMPILAVIFGKDGVGKSTFCASAPRAVFIAVESGLDNIDAQAIKPQPTSWSDIINAVDALANDDRVGTIVLDSIDWAEQLCWAHIVATKPHEKGHKVKDIEGYGYGKGYVAALNEWRILLAALNRAREKGKGVLLIGHALRKSVKNPTGDDYESWTIKLNEKAAGLIREWVDVVGFAELDVALVEQDGRQKGISTGKRIIRTQPAAGYDSKTRFRLPAKIPLDWAAFSAAVAAGKPQSVDALDAMLSVKLTELGDADVANGCAMFLSGRGKSFASLSEAIATVDGYLAEKAASTEKKEAT